MLTALSDEQLIEKILKDNDHKSFAQLVSKHKDVVFSLILQIVKSEEDAKDVLQEVFIRIYDKLDTFRHNAKFSTWIYRIAYNAALSHFNKAKRTGTQGLTDIELASEALDSYNVIDAEYEEARAGGLLDSLENAINRLNQHEKIVITLFYLNDFSVREISSVIGLTENHIKVLLHRSRKRLYKYITSSPKLSYSIA